MVETGWLVVGLHSMPKHRLEGENVETERDEMVDLSKLIGRVFVEMLTDFWFS